MATQIMGNDNFPQDKYKFYTPKNYLGEFLIEIILNLSN